MRGPCATSLVLLTLAGTGHLCGQEYVREIQPVELRLPGRGRAPGAYLSTNMEHWYRVSLLRPDDSLHTVGTQTLPDSIRIELFGVDREERLRALRTLQPGHTYASYERAARDLQADGPLGAGFRRFPGYFVVVRLIRPGGEVVLPLATGVLRPDGRGELADLRFATGADTIRLKVEGVP